MGGCSSLVHSVHSASTRSLGFRAGWEGLIALSGAWVGPGAGERLNPEAREEGFPGRDGKSHCSHCSPCEPWTPPAHLLLLEETVCHWVWGTTLDAWEGWVCPAGLLQPISPGWEWEELSLEPKPAISPLSGDA